MTLYTEAEAAERWCPLARYKFASTSDNPSCNREGGPSGGTNPWLISGTRCIGSKCMAWRPVDVVQIGDLGLIARGYCGAFGKVEP